MMAATKDSSDYNNSEKGDDSIELYAQWPQFEEFLTYHLSFRSEERLDSAGSQTPPGKEAAEVSILVPVCPNPNLSENLYDAGFKYITTLVLWKEFMCDMLKKNVRVRPEMKWRVMDLTNMKFENETFDAIVDKGGLDTLVKTIPGSSLGSLYLSQVRRVLKAGGKYVCITFAERLVLDVLFPALRFGWEMSLYAINQEASSRHPKLQTFMVVAEKMSSPEVYVISSFLEQHFFESNSNQVRDISEALLSENSKRLEYGDDDDFIYSLQDLLFGARGNISKLVPGRRVKLSIGRPEGFAYNGVLLDAKEDSRTFKYPYAVFLIHQNLADDWLYTSEKGQWILVLSSEASRLLMILLDSSNSYLSMDDIQKDLTPLVKHLEPEDCGEGFQIPCILLMELSLLRRRQVFSCILSLQIKENFNEVLFALKTTVSPIKEDQLSGACSEFAKSLEHERKWIENEEGLSKSIKLLK